MSQPLMSGRGSDATKETLYEFEVTPRLIVNILTVSLGALLFGFHIGWPSNAMPIIDYQFGLSTGWSSMVVSVMMLGAMAGSLSGGYFASVLGRRGAILIACVALIFGAVILGIGPSSKREGADGQGERSLSGGGLASLLAGRIVSGVGVGLSSVVVPLYISEVSPASRRGGLGCMNQLMIAAGILLAFLLGYGYHGDTFKTSPSDPQQWRWSLISAAGIATALALGVLTFVPESPAWLAAKRKSASVGEGHANRGKEEPWSALLRQPHLRAVVAGVGLMVFQQFCGVNAVLGYAVTIFELAGLGPKAQVNASVIVAATQVAFTLVSVAVSDRFRRKTILVGTLATMTVCHVGLGFFFKYGAAGGGDGGDGGASKGVLAAELLLAVYIAAFSVGVGPLSWAVIAEISEESVKGHVVSICAVTSWLSAFTVTLVFRPLSDSVGPAAVFFGFAVICSIGCVFIARIVPETSIHAEVFSDLGGNRIGGRDFDNDDDNRS